ncbi:hypothetical protein Sviol_03400 [Streptomyces violascens]|uniref:Uncharacterized protein n=1 Tax=Streptomyces violascens TaxID=67381 RepID=A0ABQ3QF71_9ACTN|nr:hypothetical protein Sviol_03400 [Streptomyces violascens]
MSGQAARTAFARRGSIASPPAETKRSEASASGHVRATRWNTLVVRYATVTPAAWKSRSSAAGESSSSRSATTRQAPVSSAPQISMVEASEDRPYACNTASPGPGGGSWGSERTRRTTPRWGTATGLGRPVVPEVKAT